MTITETVDEFRRRKYSRPFQPFVISMVDGKTFEVPHRMAFGTDCKKRFTVVNQREGFTYLRLEDVSAITDAGLHVDTN